MPLQPSQLRDALASITDPDTKKDIVTAGLIKDIRSDGDNISIVIDLDSPDSPIGKQLKEQVEAAIRAAGQAHKEGVGAVEVTFSADTRSANQRVRDADNPLPNVRNIIAVGAGKGGVGKSTVATILAVGLAKMEQKSDCLMGIFMGHQ